MHINNPADIIYTGELMITAGIDESGRGAVIGPLVVCGASFREEDVSRLRKIRVRDSKELSPKRRERLAKAIEKIAKDIIILKLSPCSIDNRKADGLNLNQMEAIKMADIINYLNPGRVFIDSPDPSTMKFRNFVKRMVKNDAELVVEHHADKNHPEVSAASIIAKVERDRDIKKLSQEHGPFGSGYASDERTILWLKHWLSNNTKFPDFVRRSWITAQLMEKEKFQSRLSGWFKEKK